MAKKINIPTHKNFQDLTGQQFHRFKVLEFARQDKYSVSRWKCECDCGKIKEVSSNSLKSGDSKSCGCYKNERNGSRMRTHGQSSTSMYRIWGLILDRCSNPKTAAYPNYGGRGIKICDRWKSFVNFAEDMGERPSLKHSIDRIDVNGNYEPDNCRWATALEQCNNTRFNIVVEWEGANYTLKNLCRHLGVNYQLVWTRVRKQNMPLKEAIIKPSRNRNTTKRQ